MSTAVLGLPVLDDVEDDDDTLHVVCCDDYQTVCGEPNPSGETQDTDDQITCAICALTWYHQLPCESLTCPWRD